MAHDKCQICRDVELGIIVGDHPYQCECHLLLMPTEPLTALTDDALTHMREQIVAMNLELDELWDTIERMSQRPRLRLVT